MRTILAVSDDGVVASHISRGLLARVRTRHDGLPRYPGCSLDSRFGGIGTTSNGTLRRWYYFTLHRAAMWITISNGTVLPFFVAAALGGDVWHWNTD